MKDCWRRSSKGPTIYHDVESVQRKPRVGRRRLHAEHPPEAGVYGQVPCIVIAKQQVEEMLLGFKNKSCSGWEICKGPKV